MRAAATRQPQCLTHPTRLPKARREALRIQLGICRVGRLLRYSMANKNDWTSGQKLEDNCISTYCTT